MRNSLSAPLAILTCIVAACSETSAPVTATGAAMLVAASPTSISATVGDTIVALPSVIVRDSHGNPMSGVVVTFTITRGAGSIVGRTVTSNSSGVATLSGWTLGFKPGMNEVTARRGSVQAVIFQATAVAGPAVLLEKFVGDDQFAAPGSAVLIRPAVRVLDAFNNALPDISVTFAVGSGGGILSGATAVSDSMGVATVGGWTLGAAQQQSIMARSGSLAPAVFTAAAIQPVPNCALSGGLFTGVVIHSELTTRSCQDSDGRLLEAFSMLASTGEAYDFTITSSEFDTYLELWDGRGKPIASSDDRSKSNTTSRFKALLPPGLFTVVASTARPGTLGKYDVSYSSASTNVSGCEPTFIVRGVTTTHQEVTGQDCVVSPTRSEDRYRVWITAGTSLTIDLEDWSYSDQNFEMTDSNGTVLGKSQYNGGYGYLLVFTAPADGYYVIRVFGTAYEGLEYTLSLR